MNPKEAEARALGKTRLDLLEPVAEKQIAEALSNGADRHGLRNFTQSPIAARVYIAAIRRHVDAWLAGEDNAEDSGLHHLAHVGANVHVVLAAIEAGTFIDDRQPPVEEEWADNLDHDCPADTPMGSCEPRCGAEACEEVAAEDPESDCWRFGCPGCPPVEWLTPAYASNVQRSMTEMDEGDAEPVFVTCPASHDDIADFWKDAGRPQGSPAPAFTVGDLVRVMSHPTRPEDIGTIGRITSTVRGAGPYRGFTLFTVGPHNYLACELERTVS
jgi:hypothetical protein